MAYVATLMRKEGLRLDTFFFDTFPRPEIFLAENGKKRPDQRRLNPMMPSHGERIDTKD